QLLNARKTNRQSVNTSIDLGLTQVCVNLTDDGVDLSTDEHLSWQQVEKINDSPTACFALDHRQLTRVQVFSPTTNRLCSLLPTESAPALMVAGFPMHRIKDTNPRLDSLSKVRSVRPVIGRVLDTTTGLGYTAVE